ncbi:MAG: PTS sugar transporter subunit IIA [Desulfovibrio sp.]|jgi:PTS system mannose-specific IIA component|nr:PTS sugar transporter subunit IIA [Desulfovibrio sp.]
MSSEETLDAQAGIILVSYADYGTAMLRAAESVLGALSDCTSISVTMETEVSEIVRRLEEAVNLLEKGAGVIVLTDMFGGTPTNIALALLGKHTRLEVVTGVNLPMLLKVFTQRAMPLEDLAHTAREAGVNGIFVAGELLREKCPKA